MINRNARGRRQRRQTGISARQQRKRRARGRREFTRAEYNHMWRQADGAEPDKWSRRIRHFMAVYAGNEEAGRLYA